MKYRVLTTVSAERDLAQLLRSEPSAYKKAIKLIDELREHPRMGTGHPEQLKGNRSNQWSRRITQKHRLVYEIFDTEVVVLVLAACGHYGDR